MKVAISQELVVFGGRIKVLLGITDALNQLGIEPIWVTGRMPGSDAEIAERYDSTAKYRAQRLPYGPRRIGEISRVRFNRGVVNWSRENRVDWIINSSNTVQGFNAFENVVSYIHYPREARAASRLHDIHDLDSRCHPPQLKYWRKQLDRIVFRFGSLTSDHRVIANSQFTLDAWKRSYPEYQLEHTPQVIYPFADEPERPLAQIEDRKGVVASLGRFCRPKRQLEQVKIAAQTPELMFRLMGHVGDGAEAKYYEEVQHAVQQAREGNVELLANLPFSSVAEHLKASRYFVHTNIDEPFGITSAEAILAGCVPIVHDSGGQREVVPISELRFLDLDEVPEKLRRLEQDSDSRRRHLEFLRHHVLNNFTHSTFVQQFRDYFEENCVPSRSRAA